MRTIKRVIIEPRSMNGQGNEHKRFRIDFQRHGLMKVSFHIHRLLSFSLMPQALLVFPSQNTHTHILNHTPPAFAYKDTYPFDITVALCSLCCMDLFYSMSLHQSAYIFIQKKENFNTCNVKKYF